jgi:hypothetical protein
MIITLAHILLVISLSIIVVLISITYSKYLSPIIKKKKERERISREIQRFDTELNNEIKRYNILKNKLNRNFEDISDFLRNNKQNEMYDVFEVDQILLDCKNNVNKIKGILQEIDSLKKRIDGIDKSE